MLDDGVLPDDGSLSSTMVLGVAAHRRSSRSLSLPPAASGRPGLQKRTTTVAGGAKGLACKSFKQTNTHHLCSQDDC